jgi:hypothetical protein
MRRDSAEPKSGTHFAPAGRKKRDDTKLRVVSLRQDVCWPANRAARPSAVPFDMRAGSRAGLEVRRRAPKAEGAANAPAALILGKLAFSRQVCKGNDDVVPSLLKGGPARVHCISRGMALSQRPAASRFDGPQQVISGVPSLTMAHHTDRASHQPLGLVLAGRPAGAIGLNHDDLQGIGHGAP